MIAFLEMQKKQGNLRRTRPGPGKALMANKLTPLSEKQIGKRPQVPVKTPRKVPAYVAALAKYSIEMRVGKSCTDDGAT